MTAPDLTPDEARAEVEAFMGEGWTVGMTNDDSIGLMVVVSATLHSVRISVCRETLRAAVDALKAAWRDAVRPWCLRTLDVAEDCIVSWESGGGDNWAYQTEQGDPMEPSDIIARVLKEDSNG